MRFCCECKFWIPATAQSHIHARMTNMEMAAQFTDATRNALNRIFTAIVTVLRLLFLSSPSAITRFVIANPIWPSIKLHSWRAFAHVTKEGVVIFPSRTPFGVQVFWKFWITAPVNHSSPCFVSDGHGSSFSVPMLEVPFGSSLIMETATGFGVPALEVDVQSDNPIPAIAYASASEVPVFIGREVGINENPCKSLTNEGVMFRHGIEHSMLTASDGRSATTGAHCDSTLQPIRFNS